MTKVHGNAKSGKPIPNLPLNLPIYGPRFVPPTYMHRQKRNTSSPKIEPVVAYLKPLTVIHPFYFSSLNKCPQCETEESTTWNSWVNTGHRELFGIRHGECALGYQLRCNSCKQAGRSQYCFATSSVGFWQKWEFWAIPRVYLILIACIPVLTHFAGGIPIFFSRSGLTRELFDLIVELRPTSTSGGLSEHIKRKY